MASTFKTLIEEFVGETENDTALSSYLTHTAREVQDGLDKDEKLSVSIRIQMEGGSYNITDKKILQVMKQVDSTGEYVMAQKMAVSKIGKVGDANSIYASEEFAPVWYIDQDTDGIPRLYTSPVPTSTYKARIYVLNIPEIAHGDSTFSVGQLNNNARTAVILGASILWLKSKLSEAIIEDGDGEVAQALTLQIDILTKKYMGEMQRLSKVKEAGDS
tara:strand:+ start:1620 stop:2270 length:651 start_codon:yes stop_codon:yes gene_type:complete